MIFLRIFDFVEERWGFVEICGRPVKPVGKNSALGSVFSAWWGFRGFEVRIGGCGVVAMIERSIATKKSNRRVANIYHCQPGPCFSGIGRPWGLLGSVSSFLVSGL